ncbi:MAG TPA: hypothetical protein VGE02_12560 [Gemmatimonadales bacterium]
MTHAASSAHCTASDDCAIFDSPMPLRAAVVLPDSVAYPVTLGWARLAVEAGDSLDLRFDADDSVLSAGVSETVLTLRAGAMETRVPLHALRGEAGVLGFAAAETLLVEYELAQSLTNAPSLRAFARLTQRLDGGTVVEHDLPWILPQPASGTFSLFGVASAVQSVTCFVNEPFPPPSSETTIRISPAAGGGPWLGFQPDGGTGASRPIVVTFDAPATAVTVTVLDPTWDGNVVQAFGPSGALIEGASVSGTGVPGQFSAPSITLSGSIARLVLTPAPGDYVAYRMLVTSGGIEVTWTCTPQVDRGGEVECVAEQPGGRPFRIISVGSFVDPLKQVALPVVTAPVDVPANGRYVLKGRGRDNARSDGGRGPGRVRGLHPAPRSGEHVHGDVAGMDDAPRGAYRLPSALEAAVHRALLVPMPSPSAALGRVLLEALTRTFSRATGSTTRTAVRTRFPVDAGARRRISRS